MQRLLKLYYVFYENSYYVIINIILRSGTASSEKCIDILISTILPLDFFPYLALFVYKLEYSIFYRIFDE